jgi:TatA/E family protein of Tat protein translocase
MPFGIGIWELLILLLVLLLVFGPKRLPEMGRQLEPAATTTTTPARERDTVS